MGIGLVGEMLIKQDLAIFQCLDFVEMEAEEVWFQN